MSRDSCSIYFPDIFECLIIHTCALVRLYVFRFSTDEGQCWNIFNFTDHPIFLAGLASEPGTKTMNISIFGYRPDDDDQPMWVAVTVDFEHLLTRECKLVYNNHSIILPLEDGCHNVEIWLLTCFK